MKFGNVFGSSVSQKQLWLGCAVVLSLLGASCRGSGTSNDVVAGSAEAQTLSATALATEVPTSAPLATATPRPAPTALPVPSPTPEFGPTGRPSSAGEVHVLTTKPEVSRPVVYDKADGEPVSVRYEYLNGSVDESYNWFVNPTYFGNPLALMVVSGEPGDAWAEVQIPTRPIMFGWVKTDQFTWSSSNFYVQVDVGTNTLKVWDGDEVIVDSVAVVTGDVGRETPLASTYIDEIMPGPSSAYGPWLLSLGVFSNAINTFGSAGGLPKVAIHGTNRPDLLGQYASNGCIRIPNEVITMLAQTVPPGTRVDLIRST